MRRHLARSGTAIGHIGHLVALERSGTLQHGDPPATGDEWTLRESMFFLWDQHASNSLSQGRATDLLTLEYK